MYDKSYIAAKYEDSCMIRLFNIISCIGGKHSLLYYLKTSGDLPKISDNSLAYCGKIIVLWEKEFYVLNELSFRNAC